MPAAGGIDGARASVTGRARVLLCGAMSFVDLIERKKSGARLSAEEIRSAVDGYVGGGVPDYQMAALLMAVRWRGLDVDETAALTDAMIASGEVYDLSDLEQPVVDKHSTGGVGDKVSLVLAPVAAACGCAVPMVSGRGLGHTGGTLDKLESIPGFCTALDPDRFHDQLRTVGVVMGAQTDRLVPADRQLYALRDVTATIDDPGLITGSILSKKIAEGTPALVLDVKVGEGAFCRDLKQARILADRMLAVAERCRLRCTALLTAMDQPLGRAVGNAVEVREALAVLRGDGPAEVRELVLELAAEMLALAEIATDSEGGRRAAARALDSGDALERFARLLEAQGGDPRVVDDRSLLPSPARTETLASPASGTVAGIDALAVGRAALALRAGRRTKEDTIDPAAGLLLQTAVGEPIERGESWITLQYGTGADVETARRLLEQALVVAPEPPEPRPLILERRA